MVCCRLLPKGLSYATIPAFHRILDSLKLVIFHLTVANIVTFFYVHNKTLIFSKNVISVNFISAEYLPKFLVNSALKSVFPEIYPKEKLQNESVTAYIGKAVKSGETIKAMKDCSFMALICLNVRGLLVLSAAVLVFLSAAAGTWVISSHLCGGLHGLSLGRLLRAACVLHCLTLGVFAFVGFACGAVSCVGIGYRLAVALLHGSLGGHCSLLGLMLRV